MRFQKVYLEISNICNLQCSFCPGTNRPKGYIEEPQFRILLDKLRPYTDYLYFHLMGEPLLHRNLKSFLELAGNAGFRVILTTNGTLLRKQKEILLSSPALHKVNVSLHSFEANDTNVSFYDYLSDCFSFGKEAESEPIVVYRLWNNGGLDSKNDEILAVMKQFFPEPWVVERKGTRLGNRVFLEYGDKFDWPDLSAKELTGNFRCYGLKDQIGVLWDGTVVPCCLDHEGDIPLGNLLTEELDSILNTPRTQAIISGFQNGIAAEELCRKCGYAKRFQ